MESKQVLPTEHTDYTEIGKVRRWWNANLCRRGKIHLIGISIIPPAAATR
jgi:hypothetical protein